LKVIKLHLIFSFIPNGLLEDISQYCQITRLHSSLISAVEWSKSSTSERPDMFLINGADNVENIDCKKQGARFIKKIKEIDGRKPGARFIILFTKKDTQNSKVIKELIENHLYDFWVFETFDSADVHRFIHTHRDKQSAENYYQEIIAAKTCTAFSNNRQPMTTKLLPAAMKPTISVFHTNGENHLCYALASLCAISIAKRGMKITLVEISNRNPQLGAIFSIQHPYLNLDHALAMYCQLPDNGFIKNCVFNSEMFLSDKNSSMEKFHRIAEHPTKLYFLPQAESADLEENSARYSAYLRQFIHDLARIVIFEKDHDHLMFICSGPASEYCYIMQELSCVNYSVANLMSGIIDTAIRYKNNSKCKTHLITDKKSKNIADDFLNIDSEGLLWAPESVIGDFLEWSYSSKPLKIRNETNRFISEILGLMSR